MEIECLLAAWRQDGGGPEASTYLEELTASLKLERVRACGISARYWLASRVLRLGAQGRYLGQSEDYSVQRKAAITMAQECRKKWGRLVWPMSQQGATSVCQIGVPTSYS